MVYTGKFRPRRNHMPCTAEVGRGAVEPTPSSSGDDDRRTLAARLAVIERRRGSSVPRKYSRKHEKRTRHAPDKVQLNNGSPCKTFVTEMRGGERELEV